MAKKTSHKKTAKKAAKKTSKKVASTTASRSGGSRGKGLGYKAGDANGKDLVIVESPSKAKTINKYLGSEYVVLASVGHVRDLPSKNPKGVKDPVPGVNIEKRFTPTYQTLDGKEAVIRDLKKAAKDALGGGGEIWFATDLDREGEAIAWHLASVIGIDPKDAKRVIFPAITKSSIEKAFKEPHPIDVDRVNAQQARRILDRIVGYQVSPLLWKKVARGLSAGRVQSVAVRLVVEREREIRAFVPDETWNIEGVFSLDDVDAKKLGPQWREFLAQRDDKNKGPTIKARNAWLADQGGIKAELVEVGGEKFELLTLGGDGEGFQTPDAKSGAEQAERIAKLAGLTNVKTSTTEDKHGKGPARWQRTITGLADPTTPYAIKSIDTKRTTTRPSPPFITSTMQQAASSRLGFGAQRTMRAAQALYEGVNIRGEGQVGLITYMRTDSTNLSAESLDMARGYIDRTYGKDYLPDGPNVYKSKNQSAQEAHEAIRPTDVTLTPDKVKSSLSDDQFKLYRIIWERFVSCQMMPAKWDSTTVLIEGGTDKATPCTFRASGRTLVFDGFYRVAGVPTATDEAVLPELKQDQPAYPFDFGVTQKFTSPPPRYSEAGLIKVLEAEGIGRPSTYASIISVIQDRNYVEQIQRAFYATDLGEVVTDKLVEAFPEIMDVGYTRDMEDKLDKIEDEHLDWIDMLSKFYGPFTERLERAHEELQHAKAEIRPAPEEYRCKTCDSGLVYRFGKNGRFLSCAAYPDCNYASPCDREGRPMTDTFVDVKCPITGRPMVKKNGRFGPFLATALEEGEDGKEVGTILNIDKKGFVTAPSIPPLLTDLPCDKCEKTHNLRSGIKGPWLGCSGFPKCRGRGSFAKLEDKQREELEKQLEAHEKAHPVPTIVRLDGTPLTDEKGRPRKDAPKVEDLLLDRDPREPGESPEQEAAQVA
ncbi:MAG: DNA topoisomerase [Planctomycetota bacterium]